MRLLVSDDKGKIFDVPGIEPAGMKAGNFFRLKREDFVKLPPGSELFMLPRRAAIGYDAGSGNFTAPEKGPCFAVAAFASPGYTATYNSAYVEIKAPKSLKPLPLFSYAACAFHKGKFYVAAVRVDSELRQELRFMNAALIRKNAARFKKIFPKNRLVRHLEKCALLYCCPAAKNFFLSRYEAPLPTSPYCNAFCLGCISCQPDSEIPITQPRIKFVPTPNEISEVALFHMENVADPVVSFGQGCEGEPLLVADVIQKAIRLIRKETKKGIININTNACSPNAISKLFDAGLDSMRVSLNSAREMYYNMYYKPRGYKFRDVLMSVKTAKKKGGFVSVNYLTMPGFTDLKSEFAAFKGLIGKYNIDMVQWRNLNYDPLRYFNQLRINVRPSELLGVREVIKALKKKYAHIMTGYFNPSKARIRRNRP
ncbi:MAG: radical SAM protein [Candidatus Omnitrophica bacterium]|nr:radical SAM protein [Candidatus Omnitrophota bacterium]MCG2705206.1 radical SAM protein [Candidatus Omnitrophota bacterium]